MSFKHVLLWGMFFLSVMITWIAIVGLANSFGARIASASGEVMRNRLELAQTVGAPIVIYSNGQEGTPLGEDWEQIVEVGNDFVCIAQTDKNQKCFPFSGIGFLKIGEATKGAQ